MVNDISTNYELKLSVIAATLDPVSTQWEGRHSTGQSVVPTVTFAEISDLDVLLIPGGFGGMEPGEQVLEFLRKIVPRTKHVITICNGSAVLAMSGTLDGRRATTNKAYWKTCTASGPKVNWVAKARWVQDGNIWTSSGVSAGIDAMLAWTEAVFGEEMASHIANGTEFTRAKSSSDDPFAALYGCEDVFAEA